jgi:hypothetical protein
MQAFAYWHLVPAQELAVCVGGNPRPFASDALRILSATPVQIPVGGTARVRVATPSAAFMGRFNLELAGAPEGLAIKNVSPVESGLEIALVSDAAKSRKGGSGNLIINVLPKTQAPAAAAAKKNRQPNVVGTLPAIPYLMVE